MAVVIFVVGNDGSGKSTFVRRIAARLEARGLSVKRKHYYHSTFCRRAMRGLMDRKVSRAKQSPDAPGEKAKRPRLPQRPGTRQRIVKAAALWLYQTAMGVEVRLRTWLCRSDILLMDRSFLDDLVSIMEAMQIESQRKLLRWMAWLFPTRRMYYLFAGHEVEFARTVGVDSSPEFHRRKGERYQQLIAELERYGVPVRRIDTGRRKSDGHLVHDGGMGE